MRAATYKYCFLGIIAVFTPGCDTSGEYCNLDQTILGLERNLRSNAGCVVIHSDRMLLIESPLSELSVPGGTAKPVETAACTAIRETREETGLRVEPKVLLKIWENGFYLFGCTTVSTPVETSISQPAEVKTILWLEANEFDSYNWRFKKQKDWLKEYLLSS